MKEDSSDTQIVQRGLLCLVAKADGETHWRHDNSRFRSVLSVRGTSFSGDTIDPNVLGNDGAKKKG